VITVDIVERDCIRESPSGSPELRRRESYAHLYAPSRVGQRCGDRASAGIDTSRLKAYRVDIAEREASVPMQQSSPNDSRCENRITASSDRYDRQAADAINDFRPTPAAGVDDAIFRRLVAGGVLLVAVPTLFTHRSCDSAVGTFWENESGKMTRRLESPSFERPAANIDYTCLFTARRQVLLAIEVSAFSGMFLLVPITRELET
jgi:hypothetical protein